ILRWLYGFWAERASEHGSTAHLVEFLHEGPKDDGLELEEVKLAPTEMDDSKAEVQDPLLEINLRTKDNHRPIYISDLMKPELRTKMEELLREFKDCFAWDYTEMPRLSRDLVEHRLPTTEDFKPFKQPPRRMSTEVELQVKEEIVRLVKAKFIRPSRYVEWLSNIVHVKKKTGAIRICVDFCNLNLATPKDEYPMPIADLLVDEA
ncbi:PREDICTED: LOW QUALITY PROTEIN, partial [Prunus dulcis]